MGLNRDVHGINTFQINMDLPVESLDMETFHLFNQWGSMDFTITLW